MVQRYDIWPCDGDLVESGNPDGDWVKHEDYEAEINALKAELAEVKLENSFLIKVNPLEIAAITAHGEELRKKDLENIQLLKADIEKLRGFAQAALKQETTDVEYRDLHEVATEFG